MMKVSESLRVTGYQVLKLRRSFMLEFFDRDTIGGEFGVFKIIRQYRDRFERVAGAVDLNA